MLNALRMSLLMLPGMPALVACGWVAGRRDGHLVIAVGHDGTRPRSWLHVKRALLEALTDDEYAAYEEALPPSEQHRRIALTWEHRHLSRRCAMLMHLEQHDDASYAEYELGLPPREMERRIMALAAARMDMTLLLPGQEAERALA